jgi:CRISPR/Cas system CSM-associated protein Csm3 (group 7 of RAMP superfamily)
MIANTECLKQGVTLTGGIDIDTHISELELSALGKGLQLMQQKGYIGANSNRGFGRVQIDIENLPDATLYENYLSENKEKIVQFLVKLGAYEPQTTIA